MPGGRVLMIAHHFPPTAGSGSNRALAFARYLPEHGWTPTVLTVEAEWASMPDAALLADLPDGLRVVHTRSFEPPFKASPGPALPPSLPKRNRALRSHVGHLKRFPDAHLGWLPFALAAARRQPYDVAYSTSGPFTSHLVGLLLKRITRKPWVAELRDGWYRWNRAIFPDYPRWRDVLERRLEAAVITSADRVVLVTDRMADSFRQQYANLPASHFSVVSNGFDARQFAPRAVLPHDGWTVLHAGALYHGRSLTTFLEAARQRIQEDAAFARDFRLTLLGTLDATARAEVARAGLDGSIKLCPQVDHAASVAAMQSADALLLVANSTLGAEATVPGKLFEYLAVGRPVIAVAPRESATADVLASTGGGWFADDPHEIACVLRQAYTRRAEPTHNIALARFDRRILTADLAHIFDEVQPRAARRA